MTQTTPAPTGWGEEDSFLASNLNQLEAVWEAGMNRRYAFYRDRTAGLPSLSLSLLETAADLQKLGGQAPGARDLLLGDLCLARAFRIVAEFGAPQFQLRVVRCFERLASLAARQSHQQKRQRDRFKYESGSSWGRSRATQEIIARMR